MGEERAFDNFDEHAVGYRDTHDKVVEMSGADSDYFSEYKIVELLKFEEADMTINILDFGCGGGSFLDAVKGVSEHTVAVEPFKGYHSSLLQREHEVFSSSEEALNKYRKKIDIIVSFGVIEHVKDPNQFLQEAYELLVEGGELILETDNKDDFLMNMDLPEFKMFYYRTAHYWYFNEKSLKNLCINSNFRNIEMNYRHGYDLSNVFHWLLDKKPTGLAKTTGISSYSNEAWRLFLEESGQAELLHVTATK